MHYHVVSCCIPLFWEMSCTSCTMIFGDTWGYLEQEQTMASPATPIPRCFSAHQCQKDAICLVRRCSPPLASISRSNCLEKVWERVQVPCVYIENSRDLGITNHLLIWLSVSVAFLSTLGIPYLSSVCLNHGITVRHFREKKDLQKNRTAALQVNGFLARVPIWKWILHKSLFSTAFGECRETSPNRQRPKSPVVPDIFSAPSLLLFSCRGCQIQLAFGAKPRLGTSRSLGVISRFHESKSNERFQRFLEHGI